MLIFPNLFLMSFIYELVEIYYFPNKKTIEVYKKYNIDRIFIYRVSTDTKSTCVIFLITCNIKTISPTKSFVRYFLKLLWPTKFTTDSIPLTLTGKILMRENCSCKSVWDTLKLKL